MTEGPGGKLTVLLEATLASFPLAAIVLRDTHGRVLAVGAPGDADRPEPEEVLEPASLLAPGDARSVDLAEDSPLPAEGGRIGVVDARQRPVGWLDVWGNGTPASAQARRALGEVAHVLAALLARGEDPGGRPR